MPVYNAGHNLQFTLQSILKQSYKNFELIVINDGSTDDSLKILSSFKKNDNRIKIINKSNTGIVDSLNIGLTVCKYDLIIRHDAEDISHIHRFHYLVNAMLCYPDISCISSLCYTFNDDFKMTGLFPLKRITNINELIDRNRVVIAHPSVIYRKNDILKVGGYPNILHSEDFFLWKQMRKNGLIFKHINIPIYAFLKTNRGITYNNYQIQLANFFSISSENVLNANIRKIIKLIHKRDKIVYGVGNELSFSIMNLYYYAIKLYVKMQLKKFKKYESGFGDYLSAR